MKPDLLTALAHLEIEKLSAGYGGFLVLRELTLSARPSVSACQRPPCCRRAMRSPRQ